MIKLLSPQLTFWLSIIIEIFTLIFLRSIGIDWDYHVDSVTYIEKSNLMAEAIYSTENISGFLNNGFYLLVDFLNSRPAYIITLNIFLFSITNYLIVLIMRPFKHRYYASYEYLILFNPYRVYLGTAILKDTLICFLVISAYFFFNLSENNSGKTSKKKKSSSNLTIKFFFRKILFISSSILLLIVAIRSAFYLILFPRFFDNPKKLFSLFIFLVLVLLLNNYLGGLFAAFDSASQVNMDFRDYGAVPNFSSFGFLGTIVRTIVWPLLYVTGTFIFLAPSLELLLISLGILMLFIVQIKMKVFPFSMISFLGLFFFAGITSGFLSFGRYSLPLWILSSIILYKNNYPKYCNS